MFLETLYFIVCHDTLEEVVLCTSSVRPIVIIINYQRINVHVCCIRNISCGVLKSHRKS